jgi:hypothetical protein
MEKIINKQLENLLKETLIQIKQVSILDLNQKENIENFLKSFEDDLKDIDMDIVSSLKEEVKDIKKTLRKS